MVKKRGAVGVGIPVNEASWRRQRHLLLPVRTRSGARIDRSLARISILSGCIFGRLDAVETRHSHLRTGGGAVSVPLSASRLLVASRPWRSSIILIILQLRRS
jgi:hypothetical protein